MKYASAIVKISLVVTWLLAFSCIVFAQTEPIERLSSIAATNGSAANASAATERPNVLFIIADDASRDSMGIYGSAYVKTPNFDRIAREGVKFTNAFNCNPKCAPARACLLTGRYSWQLQEACNHGPFLSDRWKFYPYLMEDAGYFMGYTGKGWGPGIWRGINAGGNPDKEDNPAGRPWLDRVADPPFKGISKQDYAANFKDFLDARPDDKPFCFWLGTREPHRGYGKNNWKLDGRNLDDVIVPKYFPDNEKVRGDLADYAIEVEWFDTHVGRALKHLEDRAMLDNTIVIATSDHGMPFPRVKGQVYAHGFHVPLVVRWPAGIKKAGRGVSDFVTFPDVAPTILEAAGIEAPQQFTGRSFLKQLKSEKEGRIDEDRNFTLLGKERHDIGRTDGDQVSVGYPVRAIRTDEFLYVRNYNKDRWPAGDPELGLLNTDKSPTKTELVKRAKKDPEDYYYRLSFGKRPNEEFYSASDFECLKNLADDPQFLIEKRRLRAKMEKALRDQGDPRMFGDGDIFDSYPNVNIERQREVYSNPDYDPVKEFAVKYGENFVPQSKPMGEDKNILLFDDFERDEPSPDVEMIGNGWSTNSKAQGKKQVDLDNGTLHVTMADTASHAVSIRHDLAYRDVLVEMRFKLTEGSDLGVNFADMIEKSVSAGHLCVARIHPDKVQIRDLKTGNMKTEYQELRKSEKMTDEIRAIIDSKQKLVPFETTVGAWHDLAIRIDGPTLTIEIDGQPAAEFTSNGIAHPTKSRLRLSIHKEVWIDDLKVTEISRSKPKSIDEDDLSIPDQVVKRLELDTDFYKRHTDVMGVPVLASSNVSPYAFREAKYLIKNMMAENPGVVQGIADSKVRVVIMSTREYITDVPENSDLKPKHYWDSKARGIGPTGTRVACACGEENLLDYRGDPHMDESILIHEFAHTVHRPGMEKLDPKFDAKLDKAFNDAMKKGLWKGTYAATNRMEYWAEGAQSWFDANLQNVEDHNHVNTREEVKDYDPALAALLKQAFGDGEWRFCPTMDREDLTGTHLEGYRHGREPNFRWPAPPRKREKIAKVEILPATKDNLAVPSPEKSPNVNIRFVNRSNRVYDLEWVGEGGKRTVLSKIQPWGEISADTQVGHRFVISIDGKPKGVIEAGKDDCVAIIK